MSDERKWTYPNDADLMAYAAEIAKALHALRTLKVSYGEFYIARVSIEFEDEEAGVAVVPTEHDSLGVIVPAVTS